MAIYKGSDLPSGIPEQFPGPNSGQGLPEHQRGKADDEAITASQQTLVVRLTLTQTNGEVRLKSLLYLYHPSSNARDLYTEHE